MFGFKRYQPMRVVVLEGHPDTGSYCGALAAQVVEAAKAKGAEVRLLRLSDMEFGPDLRHGYRQRTPLEPVLEEFQADILWCDMLVLIHPLWWGSAPAKLKGLFDRAFLPGFAFQYVPGKALPRKLLKGRNARIIVTSDTPSWALRWIYGNGWLKVLRRQILAFVGFGDLSARFIGPIRGGSQKTFERGLKTARAILD